MIDKALEIAARPDVIFCSFGDMLRVPGSTTDLLSVKASGGDVRIVYSPLDAVKLAEQNPAQGSRLLRRRLRNHRARHRDGRLSGGAEGPEELLAARLARAGAAGHGGDLMSSPDCRVQAFLAAGHVCTVMGYEEYVPIAAKYHVPIVVTGFEPLDILQGVLMCVQQLESGRAEVENQYSRSVRQEGNQPAQQLIREVFQVVPRKWRGMGEIPQSGLGLRDAYAAFDAERKFGVAEHARRGTRRMPQRAGVAGTDQAARMPGLRHALHARASAGRDDGFHRRRLRGLLPVSRDTRVPGCRHAIGSELMNMCAKPSTGCLQLARLSRSRSSNIPTCCWPMAAAAS